MDQIEEADGACVVEFFEAQVTRTPAATAVVFEDYFLTYEELNARANQVARALQRQGVGPEVLVGVHFSRSAEMIVALLGVLKAGGAYVPLDPSLPAERLAFLMEDTDAYLVLSEKALRNGLPAHARALSWRAIARESGENLKRSARGGNLAYVIYTSGSTGRPKGVAVEQRNLASYVRAVLERLDLPAGCSFAHISTFAADLGYTVLFPALCTGGTLHVIATERTSDGDAFARYCERHPIDVLKIVPTHLSALLEGGSAAVLPRRCLVLGGETSSWSLIERIRTLSPSCAVFNHYGPTETTVGAIAGPVGRKAGFQTVPLGTALSNTRVWILGPSGVPVADGEVGELMICGEGVGRGYWNDSELTRARFVRDPSGGRAFRTGDRARRLESGEIEFLGRFDHQVKIRGFRIELGEIEGVLAELGLPGVVVMREDASGEKRLVAYVVPPGGRALAHSELRSLLRAKLPEHMVPSAFVVMSALPVTANGKVDRTALPSPPESLDSESEYMEPHNETERVLVRIWEEVFGSERVGVRDDFFAVGGHSLIAAQMTARIAKRLGKRLPPTVVLTAPTIEQIARVLEGAAREVSRSSLVPLQREGDEPPLFCLHAGMGTILFYLGLAKHLGRTRPIYALKPRGLDDESLPHTSVETMVADYLEEVRRVQPRGPYHILGFCFGAVLALEMAQQLRRAGEDVALLVAMEGGFDYRMLTPPWAQRQLNELTRVPTRERLRILIRKAKGRTVNAMREEVAFRIGEACRLVRRPVPRLLRTRYVPRNHRRIGDSYVPQPYAGDLVLFASKGVYAWADPLLGWGSIIRGEIERCEIPLDSPDYYFGFWQSLAERMQPPQRPGLAPKRWISSGKSVPASFSAELDSERTNRYNAGGANQDQVPDDVQKGAPVTHRSFLFADARDSLPNLRTSRKPEASEWSGKSH